MDVEEESEEQESELEGGEGELYEEDSDHNDMEGAAMQDQAAVSDP